MRNTLSVLAICFVLAACDNDETVTIPLRGYAPYKEQVTKGVCAQWPKELVYSTDDRPQVEIIRAKCAELKYPLSTRPPKNYVPPCNIIIHDGDRLIPEGYHSCTQ